MSLSQDLKGLQQLHKAMTSRKDSQYENLATVLLGDRSKSDDETEEEQGTSEATVLKALEEKYDAMKDKLLIEVSQYFHDKFSKTNINFVFVFV